MVITINGKEYEIHFGIGFIRELDKKYFTQNRSGVKFGMGAEVKIPMLLANDVVTLSEILYAGTCTEKKRPTQQEIDDYVDDVEDIEALFDEVISELKKHNATKLRMKEFQELLEKQEKTLKMQK